MKIIEFEDEISVNAGYIISDDKDKELRGNQKKSQ